MRSIVRASAQYSFPVEQMGKFTYRSDERDRFEELIQVPPPAYHEGHAVLQQQHLAHEETIEREAQIEVRIGDLFMR
jgi:hypothetical protein